jgi:hypothetical protein
MEGGHVIRTMEAALAIEREENGGKSPWHLREPKISTSPEAYTKLQ